MDIYVKYISTATHALNSHTFFAADPLQPDEVWLHLWMLYTSQAPVLDLTGEHIKTKEDIKAAFHSLNLCTHDEQKSDGAKGQKANQSK